jgi:YVTN family beta-propeller protein
MMPSSGAAPVKIPLDATPSFLPGMDIAPDGGRVYVAAEIQPDAAVIKVIDTAAKRVTTTIPVGKFVRGLAITPDGRAAYVLGLREVHVVDTATNTLTTTISVAGPGEGVTGMAIAPDGRNAYVIVDEAGAGTVKVIDTVTRMVTTTTAVSAFPWGIAVTPDGRRAYVSHTGDVAAMVGLTTKETTFLDDLVGEFRMAFTPDGRRAYVAPNDVQGVSVVDLTTHEVTLAAFPPGLSTDVAITSDGRHVYVALRSAPGAPANGIIPIDTATNKIVGAPITWSATARPTAIALAESMAYVLDRFARMVVVIPIPRI